MARHPTIIWTDLQILHRQAFLISNMPPKQARPTRPAPTTRPPRQPFSTSTTTVVPSHTLSPLGYSPVPVQHLSPFPSSTNLLAETPVQAEAGPAGEGGSGSNTVDKLRSWRDDASRAHMYEAAAFWGDKVLTITCKLILKRASGSLDAELASWTRLGAPLRWSQHKISDSFSNSFRQTNRATPSPWLKSTFPHRNTRAPNVCSPILPFLKPTQCANT